MTEVTVALIKELHRHTGIGIMDCKKILTESNGNIELAIKNIQNSITIKAKRKAYNITPNGIIKIKTCNNYGIILEINCQTDFVAKNNNFQDFAEKVSDIALNNKINNINNLNERFEKERVALIAKTGENIILRRIASINGNIIGYYLHNTRIGVLIAAKDTNSKELIKQIAMHIAFSKPRFIKPEDISNEIIKNEYQMQLDIATRSGKPKEIIKRIAEGRVRKYLDEISLTNQNFIIDLKKTVGQFLKENNANITDFIRFEVGENING